MAEEVYNHYTDTAGNEHWTGVESGEHIVSRHNGKSGTEMAQLLNKLDLVQVVRCKDCKHYKQSAVADRKMCFRKDVDGIEVCYDFLPYDSCTYGERKDEVEDE